MADLRPVVTPPPLDLADILSRGRWREVVVLTYSFDLPFFESYVLPKLVGNGARSIAIAACASWLPERLARWSEARDITEAGVTYTLSQVSVPGVFHPKLVLAAAADRGAVLVGSGNISESGMAGGGDLFTLVEWTDEVPALASEAWQLCRELAGRLPVDRTFGERVESLGRLVPALAGPVRDRRLLHNLDAPILEQFFARLPDDPVEELLAWSPFTDRGLAALRSLVEHLRPRRMVLGVQPGITKIDGDRLTELRTEHPETAWEIRELAQEAPMSGMIHAKGLLTTLESGEGFGLIGSPNLSAPALLRVAAQANFEIAVLHDGTDLRRALFGKGGLITIGEEIGPDALAWEPDPTTEVVKQATPACQLIGARQQGDWLAIQVVGTPPSGATLVLDRTLTLELTPHADDWGTALAGGLSPRIVEMRWDGGGAGPVIVQDLHRLALLARGSEPQRHTPLAALDYGADSDILALLEELARLAIVSVYDVARMFHGDPLTPESEVLETADDLPLVRLDEIDFDRVRQHPRARAYDLGPGGDGYDTPRLVLWLDEAVQQFERRHAAQLHGVEVPVLDDDTEDELPEIAGPERRQWSVNRRVAVLVRNRVRRAVTGMADPRLWELVDPAWMTVNYTIWLNFLERLWARTAGPTPILAETDLASLTTGLLAGYWGDDRQAGYLSRLPDDERFAAALMLADRHADALTAATLIRLIESHVGEAQETPFVAAKYVAVAGPLGLLAEEVVERALVYLDRSDESAEPYLQRLLATENAFSWDRFATNLAWRHHRQSVAVRSDAPGAGRFLAGDVLVVDSGHELTLTEAALRVFADWVQEVRARAPGRTAIHMAWGSALILIYDVLDRVVLQRPTAGGAAVVIADDTLPEDIATIALDDAPSAIA